MDYLIAKCRIFTSLFSSHLKNESPRKIQRNVHLQNIFKILSWNDPYISWCCLLAINFLFWLIVHFKLKPLGIIFSVILILFVYDNFFGSIVDTQFQVSEEMEQYFYIINLLCATLSTMRKETPAVFCFVMSFLFLILSFIAQTISGILLAYLIMLGMFSIPIGYSKLPINVQSGIRETLKSILSQDVINEDDLIPINLHAKGDDNDVESLDTDKTADSVTNSLISGISSMPSFLDADDNNELMEEDLIPVHSMNSREVTPNIGDLSSDSDSDIREMRFKDSHFNKDSSSDDGDKFEEGLYFSEDTLDSTTTQKESNKLVKSLVDYVASSGFQLSDLASAIGMRQDTKSTKNESSSDSDFEVINPEDVNK